MAYVTIRDIAKQAHTSVSTVSRALNGSEHIAPATKRAVEAAIKELNYIPNSRAQAMRSSKTWTTGLLVPDIRNSYFAALAYYAQVELFNSGYSTLMGTSSETIVGQDSYIDNLLAQHIDGAIITPQGSLSPSLTLLIERNLPLVFVDRSLEPASIEEAGLSNALTEKVESVPVVDADPVPGLEAALRDVKAYGHRRIGYIPGPVDTVHTLRLRLGAFRYLSRALFDAEDLFVGAGTPRVDDTTGVEHEVISMVEHGVTAIIFGYSPDAAAGIIACHSRGINIGSTLSIVSFDDIPLFSLTSPGIAMISQNVNVMGRSAARLLLRRIGGETVASIHMPTSYYHCDSVGPVGRHEPNASKGA